MKIDIFFQTKRPMRSDILHALQISFMSNFIEESYSLTSAFAYNLLPYIVLAEVQERNDFSMICSLKDYYSIPVPYIIVDVL